MSHRVMVPDKEDGTSEDLSEDDDGFIGDFSEEDEGFNLCKCTKVTLSIACGILCCLGCLIALLIFLAIRFLVNDIDKCASTEQAEQTAYISYFDTDGDGLISAPEFVKGADARGSTESAALAKFKAADTNSDGFLDRAEVDTALTQWGTGCLQATSCESCLQFSDENHPQGSCRWYASERMCHGLGYKRIAKDNGNCEIPINSIGQCTGQDYPYQIGEFLSRRPCDMMGWTRQSTIHFLSHMQAFRTYPAGVTGLFDLATGTPLVEAAEGGEAKDFIVSGCADWGSGTVESDVVGKLMAAEKPGITIHLGDVYWVGTPEQYKTNVAGMPPNEHQKGVFFPKGYHSTFLTGGNHEQISGYSGLFVEGFVYSGQVASYAAYQSDSWRIVILDSAYRSYDLFPGGARNMHAETDAPQPPEVVKWLEDVVKLDDPNDKRGIILMTHHMPYSDFDKEYLGTAKQLNKLLKGRTVVWFFGHEHRLAFYTKIRLQEKDAQGQPAFTSDFELHPRMIGNGGFPDIMYPPKTEEALLMYDNRTYQTIPQDPFAPALISFNGFFKLAFHGDEMRVSYITAQCTVADNCDLGLSATSGTTVAQETYTVDKQSGNIEHKWDLVTDHLTKSRKFEMFSDVKEAVTANYGSDNGPDDFLLGLVVDEL